MSLNQFFPPKEYHCWTGPILHSQGSPSPSHCWRPKAWSRVGRSRASAAPYRSLWPSMERAMRRVLQMLSDMAPCWPRGPRLFCCMCKASKKCSTASLPGEREDTYLLQLKVCMSHPQANRIHQILSPDCPMIIHHIAQHQTLHNRCSQYPCCNSASQQPQAKSQAEHRELPLQILSIERG